MVVVVVVLMRGSSGLGGAELLPYAGRRGLQRDAGCRESVAVLGCFWVVGLVGVVVLVKVIPADVF